MSDRQFVVIEYVHGHLGIGQIRKTAFGGNVSVAEELPAAQVADMLTRFLERAENAEDEVERLSSRRWWRR